MGKFKRKAKKKVKLIVYSRSSGILQKDLIFETNEEIAAYLCELRRMHDKEAEYIANNLGLIY